MIAPVHRPNRCRNHGRAGVFERFAWLQVRLLADNAFAFNFFNVTGRIGDYPVTRNELCGLDTDVRNGHMIGKNVAVLLRL